MTHPRLLASNGRVAHKSLEGKVEAEFFRQGKQRSVVVPVAELCRRAEGAIDCQLLFGAGFLELDLDETKGWAFGQALDDGYVGWVRYEALGDAIDPTHKFSTFGGQVYTAPHLKSKPLMSLPYGARLAVGPEREEFYEIQNGGYVARPQIRSIDEYCEDFVATAERFLGVPYLWGGDSNWGLDCSGLVKVAVTSSGRGCPRDSDMQEAGLGDLLTKDDVVTRGDLIFWAGHIGIMLDSTQLLHSNAYHMAVAIEELAVTENRIAKAGGGKITARRRLSPLYSTAI